MKRVVAIMFPVVFCAALRAENEPRVLAEVKPLPKALSDDFEFRKTSIYLLSLEGHRIDDRDSRRGKVSAGSGATALNFERQYHMHGAVTRLDLRRRAGHYFTFFWRAKRPAEVTVRLEYRQEELRSHVQAQEISYRNARGNMSTDFKVIGDDFLDDGRVLAWRCLLIEGGQIVAEHRSYLWEQ